MDQSAEENGLTPEEVQALGAAAAWYAKYHATMNAEEADDPSAAAMVDRENYLTLLDGLRKLGFRVRNPLRPAEALQRKAA